MLSSIRPEMIPFFSQNNLKKLRRRIINVPTLRVDCEGSYQVDGRHQTFQFQIRPLELLLTSFVLKCKVSLALREHAILFLKTCRGLLFSNFF